MKEATQAGGEGGERTGEGDSVSTRRLQGLKAGQKCARCASATCACEKGALRWTRTIERASVSSAIPGDTGR